MWINFRGSDVYHKILSTTKIYMCAVYYSKSGHICFLHATIKMLHTFNFCCFIPPKKSFSSKGWIAIILLLIQITILLSYPSVRYIYRYILILLYLYILYLYLYLIASVRYIYCFIMIIHKPSIANVMYLYNHD